MYSIHMLLGTICVCHNKKTSLIKALLCYTFSILFVSSICPVSAMSPSLQGWNVRPSKPWPIELVAHFRQVKQHRRHQHENALSARGPKWLCHVNVTSCGWNPKVFRIGKSGPICIEKEAKKGIKFPDFASLERSYCHQNIILFHLVSIPLQNAGCLAQGFTLIRCSKSTFLFFDSLKSLLSRQ